MQLDYDLLEGCESGLVGAACGVIGGNCFGGGSTVNGVGGCNSSLGIFGKVATHCGVVEHPPSTRKLTAANRNEYRNLLDDFITLRPHDLDAVTILHYHLFDHLGLSCLFLRDYLGYPGFILIPKGLNMVSPFLVGSAFDMVDIP